MTNQNIFAPVNESLTTAQSLVIILPVNPDLDKVAASLSLYLSLKKVGKAVSVFCSSQMKVEFSDLVGIDQVKTSLGEGNLTIVFDYVEDSIEKVSYNIENNKFNLVVQPKPGFPPLASDKVEYRYSGTATDLVFLMGIGSPSELAEMKSQSGINFDEGRLVNISLQSGASRIGRGDLVVPNASSFCEVATRIIAQLRLPIDQDIATNLLSGIDRATDRLSSVKAGAGTFEAVGFCLRAGGRRLSVATSKPVSLNQSPSAMKAPVGTSSVVKPQGDRAGQPKVDSHRPASGPVVNGQVSVGKAKPSPDWFEPKIYKSDSKV